MEDLTKKISEFYESYEAILIDSEDDNPIEIGKRLVRLQKEIENLRNLNYYNSFPSRSALEEINIKPLLRNIRKKRREIHYLLEGRTDPKNLEEALFDLEDIMDEIEEEFKANPLVAEQQGICIAYSLYLYSERFPQIKDSRYYKELLRRREEIQSKA